jgi:hypothetical protein
MNSPTLPLELRKKIYLYLDDENKQLAKTLPEVFWAIAPTFFCEICIGMTFGSRLENEQTELARVYPYSCNFVETLTIITDMYHHNVIRNFLEHFPIQRKLKLVQLVYSTQQGSRISLEDLGYEPYLIDVIETSPDFSTFIP